jgi:hypothetical protein
MQFFSAWGAALLLAGLGFGVPVVLDFMRTGLVPRLPTAVLSTGLVSLSFLSFACGLILDSVTRGRKDMKRLQYLSIPPVAAQQPETTQSMTGLPLGAAPLRQDHELAR